MRGPCRVLILSYPILQSAEPAELVVGDQGMSSVAPQIVPFANLLLRTSPKIFSKAHSKTVLRISSRHFFPQRLWPDIISSTGAK